MRLWLSSCVHYREPGALRLLTVCGCKLTRTLRVSPYPQHVTCRRCIDGMGWDGGPEARMLRAIFGEPAPNPRDRPRRRRLI